MLGDTFEYGCRLADHIERCECKVHFRKGAATSLVLLFFLIAFTLTLIFFFYKGIIDLIETRNTIDMSFKS